MLDHVLGNMLENVLRHILEHVPRHVVKHVLRHVPGHPPSFTEGMFRSFNVMFEKANSKFSYIKFIIQTSSYFDLDPQAQNRVSEHCNPMILTLNLTLPLDTEPDPEPYSTIVTVPGLTWH